MSQSPLVFVRRVRGFSMVELLVGVAIALIGMVLMFQVMERWEGRKRTTSSGSDAQVSGSIAVFSVERDLRMAGHGIGSATTETGCSVVAQPHLHSSCCRCRLPMVQAVRRIR